MTNKTVIDEISQQILQSVGIECDQEGNIPCVLIEREVFLDSEKYTVLRKTLVPKLKHVYSSSHFTSLHQGAERAQRWPLLNLVRQILHQHGYSMRPVRQCDGYSKDGKKLFRRFFGIDKNEKKKTFSVDQEQETKRNETA